MLPPRCIRHRSISIRAAAFALILIASAYGNTLLAAPPGAVISNQASVDYINTAGLASVATSNEVQVVTAVIRSPSTISFTRVASGGTLQSPLGPSACFQTGSFVTLADPVLSGGISIDPTQTQESVLAPAYNLGEPLFIRLEDSDQNVDAAVVDYVEVSVVHDVSGDTETIRLTESGVSSGVFVGYLPSADGGANANDCVLQGSMATDVRVLYTDPADATDSSATQARLDPLSVVFDSQTGLPIDGITVQIIDAVSGLPATVYGNDGVSVFPNTLESGTTVSDSGGTSYAFTNGQFRFPILPSGEYRIEVTPSTDYLAPSSVSISDLQLLPNAPFDLAAPSFGSSFVHDGAGLLSFDIPLDPLASSLFLSKTTTTVTASPGDFVQYELVLENTSDTGTADNVRVTDNLPTGLRFVPGSVTRDGDSTNDPAIDVSTMALEFNLGAVPGGERTSLKYVAEVVSGSAGDDLVNTAIANATGGLVSNESEAGIRITEELFRNSATIIGRVVEGDCSANNFAEDDGIAGIRVYLEDGRFSVTDEGGRFHFQGLQPGTHVAQLDVETVPEYFATDGCATAPQFAGRGDSQFVDLKRGALTRADFYLRRKLPAEGRVNIELQNLGTGSADEVEYVVSLNGKGDVDVSNLQLMLMLPEGVTYDPGSLRGDDLLTKKPRISGQSLTIRLNDQMDEWQTEVRLSAHIDPSVSGELKTQALLRFDSPIEDGQKTPLANTLVVREAATVENAGYVLNLQFDVLSNVLSGADRGELDRLVADWQGVQDIQISAVGHSDSTRIAARNRHIFADNYVLSEARALAVADYVGQALNVPPGSIQFEGRGPDDPVASNDSVDGRQENRRVEMIMSGRRPGRQSFLKVTQASSGKHVAQTLGLVPGVATAMEQMLTEQALAEHLTPKEQDEAHVNSHRPGIGWVTPEEDFRPATSSLKIAVKHGLDQTVALFVNGLEVNPLNRERQEINSQRTVAVSRWAGVDLVDGGNKLIAEVIGPDGLIVERLTRDIHYAGQAVRGELVPEASKLVADGRTRPVIAMRLYDRFGEPARQTSVGAFSVEPPHRSWFEVEDSRRNDIVKVGSREPLYTIGADGIAFLELEPTTQSGNATINLKFENQRELEVNTWLEPQARDWILVGFGQGTVGYNTLANNQAAAAAAGQEEEFYDDGRLAFFAKGQIKGEYLLTLAYDSAKDKRNSLQQFQTNINPDEYYPLYADNTEEQFETPSQRKLYVKLERSQFVALFGDYDTGLSMTELSRYERRFNGLKSDYHGTRFDVSAFASKTDQSFVRDEIRGDGTSGLYRLSSAPIIGNSETIRLETRDRFDPAIVISSQPLSRFIDYNIDILDGSLFFKRPIPSRDENFDLVYIVAEYETSAGASEDVVAGGRVAVHSNDRALEVGVTHINDGQQNAQGELTGVDLRWQLTDATELKAEVADSRSELAGASLSGQAESVTINHRSERVDARAFLQNVDQDFGLGQQATAAKGIRKYGVDSRFEVTTDVDINAQASIQENLETGTERTLTTADVLYRQEDLSATLGLTYASDKFTDGVTQTSSVVDAGVSRKIFDSALTISANGSLQVGGEAENVDYPSSLLLGADYELKPGVNLFAEYEQSEGRDIDSNISRLGVRASPWHRAQINTSVSNETTEFGPRMFANVGLIQGFQLNERWSIDVGLDQSKTLTGTNIRRLDPEREFASGSLDEDFAAVFFGALYQAGLWSANSRVEYRTADSEKRTNLLAGWYREPQRGHGLSAGLSMFNSRKNDTSESYATDLRLGWAYRIADSAWSFLDRVDVIYEQANLVGSDRQTWRLVNNFNANRRIDAGSQVSLQYASKYVRSDFDSGDYTGYTDLTGLDYRRGFNAKWDAGIHTSIYQSYRSNVKDYGAGLDVGFNVRDNMWVTLGYNITGFYDNDFTAARYTAQGPYLRISIKADQHTLKRIAGQVR